ncbi:MAG TPA: lipocalin-like domain-containing protein [Casimicrobiaceae bacterium]|nr:lipocalin-like domain-containing protein [Casimicrobiaceae bacterium]
MNRRRFLATSSLLLATSSVAEDYPRVVPGHGLEFPRDFGAHPDFRNEWWYVTGWVKDGNGAPYGVQITFFRNRPRVAETSPSRFAPRQLLFAHAAIADPKLGRLRYDERAARAGFGLAEASDASTDARIDDWSLELAGREYLARVLARDFRFELRFAETQAVLLQGDAGFSRKGSALAHASYYYSEPQLNVSGSIAIDSADKRVTGTAWLDHEWSSEPLASGAAGWDWTGLNLVDGGALMAFRMRDRAGGTLWAGGALRSADGRSRSFDPDAIRFEAKRRWRSPHTGVEYPVAMEVSAGTASYVLEPLMDDQELDARASTGTVYWEGAVRALSQGREAGRGYLELTGYGKPLTL